MTDLLNYLTEQLHLGRFGNWLIVFGVALFIALGVRASLCFVMARLRSSVQTTLHRWDDVGVELLARLNTAVLFVWTVKLLSPTLDVDDSVRRSIHSIFVLATTFQFSVWAIYGVGAWRRYYLSYRVARDASSLAAVSILSRILQAVCVIIVVLTGLKNLDVDIGALVAGLGVGGIAVALAAQNILGDLLASLSIALDKPFVTGDFIVVGPQAGTVEYIGVKSTRVRAISGELLIFSNKDLLNSRIQNFKQMRERRAVFNFHIQSDTPPEKIEPVSQWAEEIVAKEKAVRFDHCGFISFTPNSYAFEVAFFVTNPDHNLYLEVQQRIVLAIGKKLNENGLHFAKPV